MSSNGRAARIAASFAHDSLEVRMETRVRSTPSSTDSADVVRSAPGTSLTPRARDALLVQIGELARSFVPRRIPRDVRDDLVQEVVIRCWEWMEEGRWTIADDDIIDAARSEHGAGPRGRSRAGATSDARRAKPSMGANWRNRRTRGCRRS